MAPQEERAMNMLHLGLGRYLCSEMACEVCYQKGLSIEVQRQTDRDAYTIRLYCPGHDEEVEATVPGRELAQAWQDQGKKSVRDVLAAYLPRFKSFKP